MNEKKIRVAVLFGGVSSEHEISLMSVQSVLRNMPEDYEVLTIGITKDGRWSVLHNLQAYSEVPTGQTSARFHVRWTPRQTVRQLGFFSRS